MFEKQEEFQIPVEPFIKQGGSILNKIAIDPATYLLIPIVKIILLIIFTMIASRLLNKLLDWLFRHSLVKGNQANTLHKLIKSTCKYVLYFICLITILINIGFDPMPILTGASILGLAVGFGAQSLVKDVIAGFFLIFERQLEVGDIVQLNNQIKGTVEEIGLRITKIREYNQRLHYLSNGEIYQVTNYNREKMRAVINFSAPYEVDLDKIDKILVKVCDQIYEKYNTILLEKPETTGITRIDQQGIHLSLSALCLPDEYVFVERQIRKEVIAAFQQNGVNINLPNQMYIPVNELQTKSNSV
jgi:small conductance mechanosensitive channel